MAEPTPKRRRASSVGTEDGQAPKKKAKRGKTRDWSREEQDRVIHLMASGWSDEEIADYYFLRPEMNVCSPCQSFTLTCKDFAHYLFR